MIIAELADELAHTLRGRVERDIRLASFTTYRLGGTAALFVEPADEDDLVAAAGILGAAQGTPLPLLVLGRGSNLVVADGGWPGVVVHLGTAFAALTIDDSLVTAGAAIPLPQVANRVARRGLAGLEFLIAIPGSVGGAVRMNAGAHGAEIADTLVTARVLRMDTGEVTDRPAAELGLVYRRSNLTDLDIVVDARFELTRDEPEAIKERTESYRKHRAATQPGAVQNAGSVFKNPPGDHAGRLVEAAGLKGFRIGGASVSTLHANFFMAEPGATSQDVYDLVQAVRARVHDASGVVLEPEIRFIGDFVDHDRPMETRDS